MPQDAPNADTGLSLESLNQAFAEMLGSGADPYDEAPEPAEASVVGGPALPVAELSSGLDEDQYVDIAPRTILEAMLFVGTPAGEPLTAVRIAGLMRGVRPDEIDELVCELNEEYQADNCPYTIRSIGDGYRLELREVFEPLREKFFGRVRRARLSSSAIEVLSLVAYRGPLTHEEIAELRGAPCRAVLSQLVRRELLSLERVAADKKAGLPRRAIYRVTGRFLQMFGLKSLDELPRGHDIETR
jgi:segregation and condensation protein B